MNKVEKVLVSLAVAGAVGFSFAFYLGAYKLSLTLSKRTGSDFNSSFGKK
jgi:hypothetical protein